MEPQRRARQVSRRRLLEGGLAAGAVAAVGPALPGLVDIGAGVGLGALVPIATTVAAPPITTRAEWGANEAIRTASRDFAPITKAVVHHTVTANADADPAARVRGIYQYHVEANGWQDVGYNFLVDASGRIYEGRWARPYEAGEVHTGEDATGRGVVGAHARDHNTGTVGIAILGTFTSDATVVPDPALVSVARIVAWKFGGRRLDPVGATPFRNADGATVTFPNISGHRDVVETGCPGNGLYARLPELRTRVGELLQRGLVGYRVLSAGGSITSLGAAGGLRDLVDAGRPNASIRGGAGTPSGYGVWMVGADGGIFSFGDAPFFGSMGGRRLNLPIVGMAAHPGGRGYWMVATDGGIFSFGDARFLGSTGAIRLNQPIVGMASTPSGLGYWMVASDGGIFSFGDARFFGSTGGISLVQPITAMASTPSGAGYWMVARDGGVFTFGDATFLGSAAGMAGFVGPARGLAATPSGLGYWVLDDTGRPHPFGDAPTFAGAVPADRRPALGLVPVSRA